MLSDEGFTLEDIYSTSSGKSKKGGKTGSSDANYPIYYLIDDPDVTYTRGKPNEDIKKNMRKYDYDPDMKGEFKKFREKHMTTKKPEKIPQETSQETPQETPQEDA